MSRAKWVWASGVGLALIVVGSVVFVNARSEEQSNTDSARKSDASAAAQPMPSAERGSDFTQPGVEGGTAVPGSSFDPASLKAGDLPMQLTIEPECAIHGDPMTAKLVAVPGTYVSLIVTYADGQSFSTWYAGPTAPDGSLTYPWVVPPNAAIGRGHVFAAGHDPATERSGNIATAFQIAGAKGC